MCQIILLYFRLIKLNDTILPSLMWGKKNCTIPALERNERGMLSAWSDVAGCDKNQMHERYLIIPESTYGSCHMPLTPRRITHGGRVYEELSDDRNEVTHTSTCSPIALEIFSRALRPSRKSARRADPRMTKRIIASGFIGVAAI